MLLWPRSWDVPAGLMEGASATASREAADAGDIQFPPPPDRPLPRDDVVFKMDGFQRTGRVVGYDRMGRLVVQVPALDRSMNLSPDTVRLKSPGRTPSRALDLVPGGRIIRATEAEASRIDSALRKAVGGGCTVQDVLVEFWDHGYETYVVGGAVRDALLGIEPKDVDLVGTMPIGKAHGICRTMGSAIDRLTHKGQVGGHIRLGLKIADYCSFHHSGRYTMNAVFDADFERDALQRDFRCNAVYYDWKNQLFIEPLDGSIRHAEQKILDRAWSDDYTNNYGVGKIVVRCLKFLLRGFTLDPGFQQTIAADANRGITAVPPHVMKRYARRLLMGGNDSERRVAELERIAIEIGIESSWVDHIRPLLVGEGSRAQ
jgi:hypothetical protein